MAIVAMQKVAILAHSSLREEVISFLHEEGVVEITEASDAIAVDHTDVDVRRADLQFAIQTLTEVASKETKAASAKAAEVEDIMKAAKHTDVRGIVEELRKLEELDTNAERESQEAQMLVEQLDLWTPLQEDLTPETVSNTTVRFLGTLPDLQRDALRDALKAELPKVHTEELKCAGGQCSFVAHVWKEDAQRFEEIATGLGWTNVEFPAISGTPQVLHEDALMTIKRLEQDQAKNSVEREKLSVELPNLLKVEQFLYWLDQKQTVREAASETESTFTLLGWMPRDKVDLLESHLEKLSEATTVLKIKADEEEETPILLKNSKVIAPFESVTNLYGLPLQGEMDPTRALSPFFILYFALCLTDAGYGAIIALIFGTVLWKTKKSIQEAKLLWLLFFGGVMTFLVSIPFGGWFGLRPDQVPAFLTKETAEGLFFRGQIWNLSLQSGINFLQNLSLVLGITHLFFGMFLAGQHKWVHGKKAEALWVDFTSHLLLGAVIVHAVAPASIASLTKLLLYVSLVIFVWGKGYGSKWYVRPINGLLGLLNFVIGLISNGLSYLRILALGLVTGAIAAAINQVAVEIGKLFPVWIAIPVIILIFVVGHLVSIALNTLGSFIHSGRLQFIEFFSPSFEGGGRGFSPFKRTTSSQT